MRRRLIGALAACSLAFGGGAGSLSALSEQLQQGTAATATGDVVGTVALEVAGESPPPMLSPYARRRYAPPPTGGRTAPVENVVLYVVISGAVDPAGAEDATISQRDRTISPHTTVVRAGASIHFPNDDNVFHNLFSLSRPRPFNLGRYSPGDSRTVTFERAGIVRMFCDIHSEMSGTIVVLDTPYFARADGSGRFRIRDVPAGRHTLVAWHESTGTVSREIVVRVGQEIRVDLRLSR